MLRCQASPRHGFPTKINKKTFRTKGDMPKQKVETSEENSIFSLKIHICNLKIRICNLKIYICSLKIEFSSDLFTFPTGFSDFIRGENKKSSLVF